MGRHTYHQLAIHVVFGTKARQPLITSDIEPHIYRAFFGIAEQEKFSIVIANGTTDHVHLLLDLPPAISVSHALQRLKGVSSFRIGRKFEQLSSFSWQEGFACFSVSKSRLEHTIRYIRRQKEHHQQQTFPQEYQKLLEMHEISWDPRYPPLP